jgi:hypothetical protein
MTAFLDPELVVRRQRWEQLQNEAEQFRRHRQLTEESRSSRRRSRWRLL